MKYANQIQKLLCITDAQYEADYLQRYIHWCLDQVRPSIEAMRKKPTEATQSMYHADLQKVLANSAINHYYTGMHDELEFQVVQVLTPQKDRVTLPKLRELYDVMMADIFKSYPKPLIEAAKKLSITGHDPAAN